MSGLLEVMGMIDETVLRKMVSDSSIVTPAAQHCIESTVINEERSAGITRYSVLMMIVIETRKLYYKQHSREEVMQYVKNDSAKITSLHLIIKKPFFLGV